MSYYVKSAKKIQGEITIPGDKSISHRLIILGALGNGITRGINFPLNEDCLSSIHAFQKMGIDIQLHPDRKEISIFGKGLHGLSAPTSPIYTGNSGTTTRLLAGLLCGQNFPSILTGDNSLNARPMDRLIHPLTSMGGHIRSQYANGLAPLSISPSALHGIIYHNHLSSAQVKSSILLAGLYADGPSCIIEKSLSRDHTIRMISAMGGNTSIHKVKEATATTLIPGTPLSPICMDIPGDISSASFFIAATLLLPNSELLIKNVGMNQTRSGILKVCKAMGGKIEEYHHRLSGNEPVCDLLVTSSTLHGTTIHKDMIPSLIDEIPILAILAAFADSTTIIRGAEELKVKESDRLQSICSNLISMGVDIVPTSDGMIIHGGKPLSFANIQTHMDHRIAMAFFIAGLTNGLGIMLDNTSCISISFPAFISTMEQLCKY